jgi:hypothetical protein
VNTSFSFTTNSTGVPQLQEHHVLLEKKYVNVMHKVEYSINLMIQKQNLNTSQILLHERADQQHV